MSRIRRSRLRQDAVAPCALFAVVALMSIWIVALGGVLVAIAWTVISR